jgi:hypothetical protein
MKVEVWLSFEVSDALTIIYAATTDDTMYLVAFVKQELAQV